MKRIVIWVAYTAAVIVFAQCAPVYAQTCDPGPECKAADAEAQNAMAGWQSLLSEPSTHIASEVAYCSNMAVVEVARICEQEFRKMGNSACADIAAEQARQSQLSADSAHSAAADSAASSNWQANCSEIGKGSAADSVTPQDPDSSLVNGADMAALAAKMTGTWTASQETDFGTKTWTIAIQVTPDGRVSGSYQSATVGGALPSNSSSSYEGYIDLASDSIIGTIILDGESYQSKIIDISSQPKIDDGWTFKPALTKN